MNCTKLKLIFPLLVLAVSVQTQAKTGLIDVSVCLPNFREEYLTLVAAIAKDQHFFERQGLNVSFEVVDRFEDDGESEETRKGEERVIEEVSSEKGKCDFASMTIESLLAADKEKSAKLKPLLFSLYGDGYDTHLVVGKNQGIKTVKDLKGKTIRAGHVPTRIALEKILSEEGMSLKDVKIVSRMSSWQVPQAMSGGQLDAAITYVPVMPILLAGGDVTVLKEDLIKNYVLEKIPHALLVVKKSYSAKKAEVVEKFLTAVKQANDFVNKNPSEAIYGYQSLLKLYKESTYRDKKTSRRNRLSNVTALSPVLIEKASHFVGKQNLVGLSDSVEIAGESETVVGLVKAYEKLLLDRKLIQDSMESGFWQ